MDSRMCQTTAASSAKPELPFGGWVRLGLEREQAAEKLDPGNAHLPSDAGPKSGSGKLEAAMTVAADLRKWRQSLMDPGPARISPRNALVLSCVSQSNYV
jgi:hypothetical protein